MVTATSRLSGYQKYDPTATSMLLSDWSLPFITFTPGIKILTSKFQYS